jgi:hypothetical protein
MKPIYAVLSVLLLSLFCVCSPAPAAADNSHVRIVRLSLVQGDVRYAREFRNDSLADNKAVWQNASLNLPIREGYALSTGAGRAAVEFENGAMAFLSENTVVEFYDLSNHDGGRISRLVIRQGAGVFFVTPVTGDYFSVTGGDFTVESTSATTFRVENFDDGSSVSVSRGSVGVVRNEQTTFLDKGRSLSIHSSDPSKPVIARSSAPDDFDKWAANRVETTVVAANNSSQYVNSTSYVPGFADLYTYGSWFSLPGYGYGWRPFGAGLGWSPFDAAFGSWGFDPGLGYSFYGSAPWGWLPYHYGGWVMSPTYGWIWTPSGFAGGGSSFGYRPATAVFVRSGGTLGVVPVSPMDVHGKSAANMSAGVYEVRGGLVTKTLTPSVAAQWSMVKIGPHDTLGHEVAPMVGAPARMQTSMISRTSVAFDPSSSRFAAPHSLAAVRAANLSAPAVRGLNQVLATRNALTTATRASSAMPASLPGRRGPYASAAMRGGAMNFPASSASPASSSRAAAPAASGGRAH